MNKRIVAGVLLMVVALVARATLVVSEDWNSGFTPGNGVVPDGNPTGWVDTRSFSGLDSSGIDQVTVRLNITGGYNGDLYGRLVHRDLSGNTAGFSVLLNRVGTGSGDAFQMLFGFSTSGFDHVTLSDGGATSIHDEAIPTGGTYMTDGGSLASFNGFSANGTWTLFLADMSTGNQSTVDSWGLDISVVPEPVTWAMALFATGFVAIRARNRFRTTA